MTRDFKCCCANKSTNRDYFLMQGRPQQPQGHNETIHTLIEQLLLLQINFLKITHIKRAQKRKVNKLFFEA